MCIRDRPCAAASGLIHPKPAATKRGCQRLCRPRHPCATLRHHRATHRRPRPKPQPQPQPQTLIDPLASSIHIDDPNEPHAPRTSHLARTHARTNERSLEIVRSAWRTAGQPTTRWETLYFTACLIFKLAFIRPPPWSPAGHRGKTTPGSVSAQSLRSVSPPSGKGSAVL